MPLFFWRMMMKRIVTIQDISCVGRCSLTVALPIISAMGIETGVIPTAVLSNHTAFEEGFTFHDLTDEIPGILDQWHKNGFRFDAVYSGYLGSKEQCDLVIRLFDEFTDEDALRFADPAMADFGKLYPGFSRTFPRDMKRVCEKADVIVPNLTEACLMTGTPYREDYTKDDLKGLIKSLATGNVKYSVLTGAPDGDDRLGVLCYDRVADDFHEYYNEKVPMQFHGTGDIFASTMAGALTKGLGIDEAMKLAVDFTLECMKKTMADPDRKWYGVNFEEAIPFLVGELEKRAQSGKSV